MSTQITTAFVQQYRTGVERLVQQRGSRFRSRVRVESGIQGTTAYFDQLGSTAAVQRLTRHANTPQLDTPHARRKLDLLTYDWADLVDKPDMVRTLNEMTSPYQVNAADAMGRAMDDLIIAAATGTAYTGVAGATSASLATANTITWGSASLTISKLRSAKEILDAFENDPDEERYIACTAKQITNLLATTEVTSSDYNSVKALVQGQLNTFLGFNFVRTERLGLDSGGQRINFAWRKSALCLGIGNDVYSRISERDDKNYSTQVFFSMDIGATRMEEAGVVQIKVTA